MSVRAYMSAVGIDVEDGDALDRLRVVERQPVGDARAAVVAGDGEALEPEVRHDARRWSRAIARLEYGSWSSVVGGLELSP